MPAAETDTATEMAISGKTDRHGRWGTIISLIALGFSGVSLYETVLKQARPSVYVPETMLFGRGAGNGAAIVLPVTIANHGSRDTVVTKLSLLVRKQGAVEVRTMASMYTGDTPGAHERLFTPIPIAGHNSSAGGVVFTLAGSERRSLFEKGPYEFCLTIQAETGDYPGISAWLPAFQPASLYFQATFPDIPEGQLIGGSVLTLKTEEAKLSRSSCGFR